MAKTNPLRISNQQARRFLLKHQGLLPPRKLNGKKEILKLLDRLGCIQFDTINVVGRNADLVLQSRVDQYKASMLEELLYKDRKLIDGWDKQASIYQNKDWPYFARRREYMRLMHHLRSEQTLEAAPELIETIRKKGAMSSIEFDDDRKADWYWAETRLVRAALEVLFARGDLGIDHRVNTRRVYDLIERLLPEKVLSASDPNPNQEAYWKWHLLRRLGSKGLASLRAGEHWAGMVNLSKSKDRRELIKQLVDEGDVLAVDVEGAKDLIYMRKMDLKTLKSISDEELPEIKAAFLAPLDNFIWNRKLIEELFGFYYVWEVYKPKIQRQYGYYVLPVLVGDQLVARIDAKMDRKTNALMIHNWWWEENIKPDKEFISALQTCLTDFICYLGAESLRLDPQIKKKDRDWMKAR